MKNQKLYSILIVVVLIVIAIIFTRIIQLPQGEVVLIKADKSPKKIKPKNPGGIVIPNADSLVYEQIKPMQNERNFKINKGPEKAIDLGFTKSHTANLLIDPIDEILNNLDFYEKHTQSNYGEELNDYVIPQNLNKKPLSKVTKDDNNSDLEIIRSNEGNSSTFKKHSSTQDSSTRGYKIHLVTSNTETQAHNHIKTINRYNPQILDKKDITIRKNYSIKGKIYYDVIASPFSTLDEAQQVCRKLNRVYCTVIW